MDQYDIPLELPLRSAQRTGLARLGHMFNDITVHEC